MSDDAAVIIAESTRLIKEAAAEIRQFRLHHVRNEIIEQCALAVEAWPSSERDYTADPLAEIAAMVRGLKDKP